VGKYEYLKDQKLLKRLLCYSSKGTTGRLGLKWLSLAYQEQLVHNWYQLGLYFIPVKPGKICILNMAQRQWANEHVQTCSYPEKPSFGARYFTLVGKYEYLKDQKLLKRLLCYSSKRHYQHLINVPHHIYIEISPCLEYWGYEL
jgi:hypothetical protein